MSWRLTGGQLILPITSIQILITITNYYFCSRYYQLPLSPPWSDPVLPAGRHPVNLWTCKRNTLPWTLLIYSDTLHCTTCTACTSLYRTILMRWMHCTELRLIVKRYKNDTLARVTLPEHTICHQDLAHASCAVLQCAGVNCTTLCAVVNCTTLWTALHRTTMDFHALYFTMYWTALHCTTRKCTKVYTVQVYLV